MGDIKSGNKAAFYIGGEKVCDIKTVEITPPQEPVYVGMDLANGPDFTIINGVGKIIRHTKLSDGSFLSPEQMETVDKAARRVSEVTGEPMETVKNFIIAYLEDVSILLGGENRRGFLSPEMFAPPSQKTIIFPLIDSKTETPPSGPFKNVRSTKDAAPWTHKREPWRAHRPKRGKR